MKVHLLLAFVVAPGLAALVLPAPAAEAAVKVTADQAPVEQWPAMADAGDPLAQALLARAFIYGTDGKAENPKDAAEWARRSAGQNHPLGMFLQGYCKYYDFTRPRARREEDAKPLFEQAIAAGFEKLAEQGGRQWLSVMGYHSAAGDLRSCLVVDSWLLRLVLISGWHSRRRMARSSRQDESLAGKPVHSTG